MLKIKKFVITLIPQLSYAGFSKFYFYKNGEQLPFTLIERLNAGLEARIKIGETTLHLHTDNIYSNRYFVDAIFGGTGSFYTATGTQNTKITVTVEEGVLDFDYATFQMWTDGYTAYYVKMLTIDFYNQHDKLTDTFTQLYSTTPEQVSFPKLGETLHIKDDSGKYYYIENKQLKESFDLENNFIENILDINLVKNEINSLQNPKLVSNDSFSIKYFNNEYNLFSDIELNIDQLDSISNIISENEIKNIGFLVKLNNKYYGTDCYKIKELSEQELLSKYIITNETIEVFNNWYRNLPIDEKNGNIIIKLYFNLKDSEELTKIILNYKQHKNKFNV